MHFPATLPQDTVASSVYTNKWDPVNRAHNIANGKDQEAPMAYDEKPLRRQHVYMDATATPINKMDPISLMYNIAMQEQIVLEKPKYEMVIPRYDSKGDRWVSQIREESRGTLFEGWYRCTVVGPGWKYTSVPCRTKREAKRCVCENILRSVAVFNHHPKYIEWVSADQQRHSLKEERILALLNNYTRRLEEGESPISMLNEYNNICGDTPIRWEYVRDPEKAKHNNVWHVFRSSIDGRVIAKAGANSKQEAKSKCAFETLKFLYRQYMSVPTKSTIGPQLGQQQQRNNQLMAAAARNNSH